MNINPDVRLFFNVDTISTSVQDNTVWPNVVIGTSTISLPEFLNMKATGSLLDPSSGVVFSRPNPNNPLINLADGDTQSSSFDLVADSSGDIVNGIYTLAYNAAGSYSASGQTIEIGASGYVEIDDDTVAAQILQAGDTLTISGDTNPDLNGTWTVVSTFWTTSSSFSRLFISKNGVPISGTGANGVIAYSIERSYVTNVAPTYSGCKKIKPSLTFDVRPYEGQFGKMIVSDTTNYGDSTVVNKTISVFYPNGLYPAPVSNPVVGNDTTSITITPLSTGLYTAILNGTVTKSLPNKLYVIYQIQDIEDQSGVKENVFVATVEWNGRLCCISECISKIFDAHYNYLKQGKESPLTDVVSGLSLAVNEYSIAVNCGDTQGINSFFENIQSLIKLSGCNCNCECNCSDAPKWIDNSNQDAPSILVQIQDQLTALQSQVNAIVPTLESAGVLSLIYIAGASPAGQTPLQDVTVGVPESNGTYSTYPTNIKSLYFEIEALSNAEDTISLTNATTSQTLVSYQAGTGVRIVRIKCQLGVSGYTYSITDDENGVIGFSNSQAGFINSPALNFSVPLNNFIISTTQEGRILSYKCYVI